MWNALKVLQVLKPWNQPPIIWKRLPIDVVLPARWLLFTWNITSAMGEWGGCEIPSFIMSLARSIVQCLQRFVRHAETIWNFCVFSFICSLFDAIIQSATLATSPKPESSRNYVWRLVKAAASLARQSEPPPTLSPLPNMHCTFATWQLKHSLEKR